MAQDAATPSPTARPLLVSDVDGVVTDGFAVVDPRVLARLAHLAGEGWSLGLVTGRSHEWLAREVLTPLQSLLPVEAHGAVTAACEFGAVVSTCEVGAAAEIRGPSLPEHARDELRHLVEEPEFARLLEWDGTKHCLACVEVRHAEARSAGQTAVDAALDEYGRRAAQIVAGLDAAVRRTTFAVDVGPTGLTKHLGTRAVLPRDGVGPSLAIALGDSDGDREMAEELREQYAGLVVFAWVGTTDPPELPETVELLRTSGTYSEGALEALAALEARS